MSEELKFDLHVHTNAVSICGEVTPEDATGLYAAAGYTGIAVTEHFHKGYFDSLGDLSWPEKVDRYMEGYRRAKAAPHGLQVYFGLEFRNTRTEDDFLVYGLTREFLCAHPEPYRLDWEEAFRLFHSAGAVVFQAHPRRMRMARCENGAVRKNYLDIEMLRQLREHPDTPRIPWGEGIRSAEANDAGSWPGFVFLDMCTLRCPQQLDGIEVYNGNLHWVQDPREIAAICAQYPQFVKLAASDFHEPVHCARGGVVLPRVPRDGQELCAMLRQGEITRLIRALEPRF